MRLRWSRQRGRNQAPGSRCWGASRPLRRRHCCQRTTTTRQAPVYVGLRAHCNMGAAAYSAMHRQIFVKRRAPFSGCSMGNAIAWTSQHRCSALLGVELMWPPVIRLGFRPWTSHGTMSCGFGWVPRRHLPGGLQTNGHKMDPFLSVWPIPHPGQEAGGTVPEAIHVAGGPWRGGEGETRRRRGRR
jgi:hypothetical protein